MKRYRQFQPVVISDFEVDRWPHPVHKHNHYELIFIKNGSGMHHINKTTVPYETGNIFLLGPEEEHYFEISRKTRFIYLKFTDLYLHSQEKEQQWAQDVEFLIKNYETRVSAFALDPGDQQIIGPIYDVILALKASDRLNEHLVWLQIVSIAAILKRNLEGAISVRRNGQDMEAMFAYIHEHIYTPENLKARVMAENFFISPDYIGPWFKRNAGITLRDYIMDYRRSLIGKRIKSGHYSLKQIADEFGLADESHVSKIMKRGGR
jgi:AraC family L-rhamnose operon regulatory protein RhaS